MPPSASGRPLHGGDFSRGPERRGELVFHRVSATEGLMTTHTQNHPTSQRGSHREEGNPVCAQPIMPPNAAGYEGPDAVATAPEYSHAVGGECPTRNTVSQHECTGGISKEVREEAVRKSM